MDPDADVSRRAVKLLESWAHQSWDVSVAEFFRPHASDEAVSTSLSTAQPVDAATTGQLQLLSGWDAYWASDNAGILEVGFYPEGDYLDVIEAAMITWLAARSTSLYGDDRERRQFGDLLVETRIYGKTHNTPVLMVSLEQATKPTSPPMTD